MFKSIREQLLEAQSRRKHISPVYKLTLEKMISVFSQFHYINSENQVVPVKGIFGNPERVIAKMKQEENFTLPIISVSRTDSDLADDRIRYGARIVSQKYWDDVAQRAIRIVSLAPRAITLVYEVGVWAKYNNDADQLTTQIELLFNPALELATTLLPHTKAFLSSDADESELTLGDAEDRVIVKKFTIDVETYIPNPLYKVTSSGKIESINADLELRVGR